MVKASICIPTYNRVCLLPFAIESVLAQTMSDWELFVCDDGSADGTADYMATVRDDRVRYVRHPQNIGKSNNMRSGFEAATGDYFIKFDDDDRLTPMFLERTCAVLDRESAIDFVGTDHWIIDIHNDRDPQKTDENSRFWGRETLPAGRIESLLETVFLRQSLQIGATLFRRGVLEEVDFLLPNVQNCEDNDLFVRLALAGKQAYYLPERLMEYRVHAEQQASDRQIPYLRDNLAYLERYRFASERLERERCKRVKDVRLTLGLRSIEAGDMVSGRELVWEARERSPLKAAVGLALSLLPAPARKPAFRALRSLKSGT